MSQLSGCGFYETDVQFELSTIRGTEVGEHCGLGIQLGSKLGSKINNDTLYKKGQSHLFFLKVLRYFKIRYVLSLGDIQHPL